MNSSNSFYYFLYLYFSFFFLSLLVFLTRGKASLIKKKIAIGTMILSFTGSFVPMTSCKTGGKVETKVKNLWTIEGWLDNDTYRLIAAGTPKMNETNKVKKKGQALMAAIFNAQNTVLEKFRGSKYSSCCYSLMEVNSEEQKLSPEIRGAVMEGTVIAKRYNEKEQYMEIIYEVKKKGLKQRILNNTREFNN